MYVCVLGVPILSLSTIFPLDFGTVPLAWYFFQDQEFPRNKRERFSRILYHLNTVRDLNHNKEVCFANLLMPYVSLLTKTFKLFGFPIF